jgi:hypothetical protein
LSHQFRNHMAVSTNICLLTDCGYVTMSDSDYLLSFSACLWSADVMIDGIKTGHVMSWDATPTKNIRSNASALVCLPIGLRCHNTIGPIYGDEHFVYIKGAIRNRKSKARQYNRWMRKDKKICNDSQTTTQRSISNTNSRKIRCEVGCPWTISSSCFTSGTCVNHDNIW